MITIPDLPYKHDALEPYISSQTLDFHYGKHHHTYATKLNQLIKGSPFEEQSLEEIIMASDGAIFNNAAQVWNHSFYWNCLSAQHHLSPSESFQAVLSTHFGSLESFIESFSDQAIGQFGSGWAWLVVDPKDKTLAITTTSNAGNPMTKGLIPILTCDVWEHAYYLDTQNQRPKYLENFWQVLNWPFIEQQYQQSIEP